jgi:hypothetical protein
MKKIPWLAVTNLVGLSVLIFGGAQLYGHYFAPQHAALQSRIVANKKRAPIHLTRRPIRRAIAATGRPTPDTTGRAP